MTNAEKFKEVFGVYATEAWAMPESDFLLWLNGEYNGVERKTGKWRMNSDYPDRLICSECSAQFDVWHWESKQMHYCPNCGAKMEVDE